MFFLKSERQEKLLQIISSSDIDRQETLREKLAAEGISVTQATLSRDMKELGIRKMSSENGGQKYSADIRQTSEIPSIVYDSLISADHAGNIVVFRCETGTAQAVCAAMDRENCCNAVGTIAGDDTIFVLMRTEQLAKELAEQFGRIIKKDNKI